MIAAQVVVETERAYSSTDVLVRAVAQPGRLMDGRPVAGFLVRRRYHGEKFFIQSAKEFSANWMEFIDQPPKEWLPVIKSKYPDFESREHDDPSGDAKPHEMSLADLSAKMSSSDFDYSNGAPRKKGRPAGVKNRPKLGLN